MIYCCESYLSLPGNPYLVGRPGGADELVRIFDEAGIQAAMTLISSADAATNETVWEAMKKHPTRIFGMCLVNARQGMKPAVEEFRRAVKDWGFTGLKHGAEPRRPAGIECGHGIAVPVQWVGVAQYRRHGAHALCQDLRHDPLGKRVTHGVQPANSASSSSTVERIDQPSSDQSLRSAKATKFSSSPLRTG